MSWFKNKKEEKNNINKVKIRMCDNKPFKVFINRSGYEVFDIVLEDNDGGVKRKHIPAHETIIYEDAPKNDAWCIYNKDLSRTEIHVPTGSVDWYLSNR
jgi:hypothetical protein